VLFPDWRDSFHMVMSTLPRAPADTGFCGKLECIDTSAGGHEHTMVGSLLCVTPFGAMTGDRQRESVCHPCSPCQLPCWKAHHAVMAGLHIHVIIGVYINSFIVPVYGQTAAAAARRAPGSP
jgi:hypothetical protein